MDIASQVNRENIELLSEKQFTELLNKLISLETTHCQELVIEKSISSKENTSDGGEDGRLHLHESFHLNQYIRHHKNFYQIKSYNVAPGDCATEILDKNNHIKTAIKQAVCDGYTYVWYIKKAMSSQMRTNRIKKTKDAFVSHNFTDVKVDIIDADYLKDWVNKFPSIIVYVKFCIYGQNFNGIRWLEQCPEYKKLYLPSVNMNRYKDEVLKYVMDPHSISPLRIIGNSGIGKSHFIINTLSLNETIKAQCLYFDCSINNDDLSCIIDLVNNYRDARCILILDNCSQRNHNMIQAQISNSKTFKLISIDSPLDGEDSYQQFSLIEITSDHQADAVHKILDQVIVGNNRDGYLPGLTEYCSGYPILAVKISHNVSLYGLEHLDLSKLFDEDVLNKMLFKKIHESERNKFEKIIMTLSFFSYIKFRSNFIFATPSHEEERLIQYQFEFLNQHFLKDFSKKDFSRICHKLIKFSFLEQKGTVIAVKPLPLAAYMIKKAIIDGEINLYDEIKPALQILNEAEDPALKMLKDAFFIQMKTIVTSNLTNLFNIINVIFGVNSPFSTAENLFTPEGSSLLRHLADIDPQLTVKLIQNLINTLSHNELLAVSGQIRRNLIWTLETLCYYEHTFEDSAKLLLRFAAAENESIANNAAGQFVHLFQLFLAGTQANYKSRVKIVSWGINHQDKQHFLKVLIKSVTRAFCNNGNFIGNTRGANDTKHLHEYQPKSNKEILEYWKDLLELLIKNFDTFTPDAVYKAFNDSILATLLEINQFEYIKNFIILFQKSSIPTPYSELINKLKWLKEYNKHTSLSKIDDLLNQLQPQTLLGRIQTQIINASYGFGNAATLEKDKYILEIAHELLLLNNKKEHFEMLVNADSWLTSELGIQIGKINAQKAKGIIHEFIDTFDLSNIKVSFISGILWGINDQDFVKECFHILVTKTDNINVIFKLAANIRINKEIFTLLLDLTNKNNLPHSVFSKLNLSQPSNLERKWFIYKLLDLDQVGIQKILDLLFFHINSKEMQSTEWLEYAQAILRKTNVFLACNQNNTDYTLHAVLVKLIELKCDTVAQISSQLNDYCIKMLHEFPINCYWYNLFPILIDKCYKIIWNKYLGELFLQDLQGAFFIKQILNLNLLFNSEDKSKLLIEWCINNKDRNAHILIARSISIFNENDQCVNFIIDLIKSFDDTSDLLHSIYLNMNEYSWIGDVSNYYLKCTNQLDKMRQHFSDNDFVLMWIKDTQHDFEQQYKSTKQREDEFNLMASRY